MGKTTRRNRRMKVVVEEESLFQFWCFFREVLLKAEDFRPKAA